ncbi:HTH_Tnp_Tc3_2 domain-containing protein [Trichonephila clavipes]|nr:HTH_Tnp_Tc3_2 domain-containing protein [Trichonephila clavipes]
MPRGRHRASFDLIFKFDRGRIVAYRDQRIPSTYWTKANNFDADLSSLEERMEPITPTCTTARDDRRIMRIAVMDRAATLRTVAQQIQSVMNHFGSARTIRRRLQQSGMSPRRSLFRLPLTGNHRCLCRQWCNERWT